jgi:hypothetical protein
MAKKKRKRAGSPSRSSGAGTATRARRGDGGTAIRPAPAMPGGPNRLERKEAARQARERLRRKMGRRRMYRRAAMGTVVALVAAGVVFLTTRPKGSSLSSEERRLLAAAPAAKKTAGCASVQTVKAYPNDHDRSHIGPGSDIASNPALSTYPSTPPASGPHSSSPLPAGVYQEAPDVYQAIHSLEHAAVIIWYAPDVANTEAGNKALTDLQTFFDKPAEQTKVIVGPYDYPGQGKAGQLPTGKQMVLVAWHHVQTCNQLSLPVAFDFVAHYRFPTPKGESYKGDAPEQPAPIG